MAYMRLGDLLVSSGIITGEQLEQALALPREDGQRLGDVLIRQGASPGTWPKSFSWSR